MELKVYFFSATLISGYLLPFRLGSGDQLLMIVARLSIPIIKNVRPQGFEF